MKKYYVGAKVIGSAIGRGEDASCMRATVLEAIREAERQIMSHETDCAVVVKVVRIVRRAAPPIEIVNTEDE
jgi:hypothetical protein